MNVDSKQMISSYDRGHSCITDCIILVITKVEDPEELDTRFSKFAPSDEDEDYADMLDSDDDMHGMDDGSSCLTE